MTLGRVCNFESEYAMNDETITAVDSHRDLGVLISAGLYAFPVMCLIWTKH